MSVSDTSFCRADLPLVDDGLLDGPNVLKPAKNDAKVEFLGELSLEEIGDRKSCFKIDDNFDEELT